MNRRVLLGFGVASAAGGLVGAILHSGFGSSVLTLVFGALLLFAGFTGFTGLAQKMRLHGAAAWIAWATVGAIAGTFFGMKFLKKISEPTFRRFLGAFIFLLGAFMIFQGLVSSRS